MRGSSARLKHVASVVAGQSPPSDAVDVLNGGVPFIQGNAEFGEGSPSPRFECATAPKTCEPGDVLLSVRAPVGALNVADQAYGIGRGLCAIRATGAHPRYLWWWAHTQIALLNSVATGSTYTAVTAEDVANLPLTLPPLEEQRRIADFLDTETTRLDRLSALRREQAARLAERAQRLLDAEIEGLAAASGFRPLRRELRSVEQGASPLCDAMPAETGQYGVLKLSAVSRGRYVAHENKAVISGYEPDPRLEVQPGDLLVTRANTPERVGDVAFVDETRPGLFLPDLIYRLTMERPQDSQFVAYALRTSRVRGHISSVARGTSQSMVKLRGEDIRDLPVPAAPAGDRVRAVRVLVEADREIDQVRDSIARSLDLIGERRQALVTAAVTGQLDVTTARGGAA